MESSQQKEVIDFLGQYTEVFNSLVKQVLHDPDKKSLNSMMDSEKLSQLLSKGVKVDTAMLFNKQMSFMNQQAELWQSATKALMGTKVEPVVSEQHNDRRFKDSEWSENPVYNYLKQSYLLNSNMMQEMVNSLHFEDAKAEEQVKFYTRQYINSVSPTNNALTNPEVCRDILESKGENLIKGLQNFIQDLQQSPADALKITQTDPDAFTLGENLAYTPGDVIYQNDLIQLIQYKASTKKVNEVPLLFIPPCVNKYYVLDMDEKKSLIKWAVSQGHTVFIISWVNPDAKLSHKGFNDYMKEGPIAALDVIEEVTKSSKINVVGYCIGGTLLATTQSYLLAKGDTRINSLTFLTTLLDFEEPGEIGVYLSEEVLPFLKKNIKEKGILDGRVLGLAFSMLRENSLFWSYFVNNYLKGKDPAPFDLLYWNSDSSNLPAETFDFYIKHTYQENNLIKDGAVEIEGVAIELSKIKTPSYFLATIADHIVLWQASYKGAKVLSGPTRFVLAGSGHLAGVVNSVDHGKYPHWVNDELSDSAEHWFEGATKNEGSWWTDWENWVAPQSGQQVTARKQGSKKHVSIEAAPGSYVKKRN
ncbi:MULTISPECIES: alpha/beta hydrolase [unclassified Colwellia]|uniref:PHA/PHB synthase family protein n=1 Tax=unclassified Colwellia TaxID=196834 RepID=UPI0015F71144|nr:MULTISPECIES: class I poly(R)-hydroxyalkanoic acid synthase [unclassified Colwellia]MBA6223204.1 class I poly(R)-hydroxyalkanoic acid synthase [Colwellia sp. MB3u-45]MBA6266671.1 class I poly(R)-hydroxyalkanoic acid synthase [Colwellia sp. MB3u-43]MBA6287613.1 class I poly(R)-hydroxyalkanoic acid synthase [Colwellia sp. MB3u-4]MBA6320604.1 class I poly(R)-hydroxyalkanoic acid synthase [Colwellia sp. MB02u-19]MBA6323857.1 class I poly(R)-hydroxyalkanoic acid synthase [Colwellia sp. MB02u-18]